MSHNVCSGNKFRSSDSSTVSCMPFFNVGSDIPLMCIDMFESISKNISMVKGRRLWAAFDPSLNEFVTVSEMRSKVADFVSVSNLAVNRDYRNIDVGVRPYFFVVRFDAQLIGEL